MDKAAPSRWTPVRKSLTHPALWRGAASFIVFGLLWEVVARYIVDNPLFLAPISEVLEQAVTLWRSGELPHHIGVSLIEFAAGFGLAAIIGILGGIALAVSQPLRNFLDPVLSMLYATPVIALGPLFILWLGIGVASKIAIILLTAVFPILINTVIGLTNTDRVMLDVARSFGATQAQIYLKVRMPAALPFIIAGLRLSVARALVGVVVAELFGARAGVGFLIMNATQGFDTASMFVGVLVLAIAGVVSVEGLKWLETRLAPWRTASDDE